MRRSRTRVRQGRERHLSRVARGDDIQMWVVYPPGFDPAKKYPVYMLLHGGPHNAHDRCARMALERAGVRELGVRRHLAQLPWLERLRPGVHRFHQSGLATLPYEDTIKAAHGSWPSPTSTAIAWRQAAAATAAFSPSLLLGREHPFKTLVAHAAVYDHVHAVRSGLRRGEAAIRHSGRGRRNLRESRRTRSAANFKTPTLVIHGQLDMRVPVNHGIELFNILQSRGVPSRLVYFPDENHWVLKPQNSLFWYRTVREWLEKYAPPGGK